MKRIICLLVAFLLMGCAFEQTQSPDEREQLLQRKEYLENKLDEQLNERYPNGYDVIAHGNVSTVFMNEMGSIDTVSRVVRIHETNELNMVWFGSNHDETSKEENYEYFYDYLDQRELLKTVAEFSYPLLTSNHVYAAFGLLPEKRGSERLNLYVALTEEELDDDQLMEELAYVLIHLDGLVILKTDGTEDEETIMTKLLCYIAGEDALKEYDPKIANPLCEDFISIPADGSYFYDSEYENEDVSASTAESVKAYLRQEWHRAC